MQGNFDLVAKTLNNTDSGIIIVDSDLHIQLWNRWLEQSSGLKSTDVLDKPLYEVYPQLNETRLLNAIYTCVSSGLSSTLSSTLNPHPLPLYTNELDRTREQFMYQQIVIKPIQDNDSTLAMLHILDVSGSVLKEQKLREQTKELHVLMEEVSSKELQTRTIFENTLDGIITIKENGIIHEFNPAAERIFGYKRDEIIDHCINQLIFTETTTEEKSIETSYSMTNSQVMITGTTQELLARKKDGSKFMLEISLNKMILRGEPLYVGSMRDITERTQAEQLIRHMAQHDTLTDLPNRSLFRERLEQSIATANRHSNEMVAVMFLDLDRFKTINDTLGHHIGDALLIAVTERLKSVTRNIDTVARLGGDEFAVIQTGVKGPDGVVKLAKKLIDKIAEPYGLEGNEVNTSTSIGITIFPQDEKDSNQLLQNADMAMYKAKNAGRNNFQFYSSEMHDEIQHTVNMEKEIRRGIDKNEFSLFYQPQIDLISGQIESVEALVRWFHPEKGMIPPNDFIPIAEDSGLILPLGDLILEQACKWAKSWQVSGGTPMRVAVNLSAVQFSDTHLAEKIMDTLGKYNLDSKYLELEITESFLMENASTTIETLNELHKLGLNLAIDDFGTGYSSLAYLKRFPVNKIKIDQSFVRDITTDKDDATIVRSVIGLGHNLGINVIAEGVETEEQLQFLQVNGCDEVQGYYIGKPMPEEALTEYMKKPVQLPGDENDITLLNIKNIAI